MTTSRGAVERRPELLAAKLTAVVAANDRRPTDDPVGIGIGVAVLVERAAWVLVDTSGSRGLGAALAWAVRRQADRLVLVTDGQAPDVAGLLARRAPGFRFDTTVHALAGTSLVPVPPTPYPAGIEAPVAHLELFDAILAAGATPVVEHGVVTGEVLGLEVCRVVDDADTGVARLEVGVGAHDRETFQMVHGQRPVIDALREVVDVVMAHRRDGAEPHPLRRLAASRLLRSRVLADPGLLGGAGALFPVAPPVPRANVKDDEPCAAATSDGALVVVCSAGVDLEAVPAAVDTAQRDGAERCIVAVARRDAVDIQHRLAGLARIPTTVVGIPD